MSNYPAPREIPAGKILITPYGMPASEVIPDLAKVEIIAQKYVAYCAIRATVRLEWQSPGWENAGSACRWTNGYWACRWFDARSNATHGARYSNDDAGEAKAREHYARLLAKDEPGAD